MEKIKTTNLISFSYTLEGDSEFPDTKVVYNIDGSSTLSRVCEAFENFIYSCGYRLGKGESIGVIERE